MTKKTITQIEYGDWQTPSDLAMEICSFLATDFQAQSVFEPNCGTGTFLQAAFSTFPDATNFLGLEINEKYVQKARNIKSSLLNIIHNDFFSYPWFKDIQQLPEPLLVIGNPPWVTNTDLMRLQSNNLPSKANFDNLSGIGAITGKSNFDISEWMISKEIEALQGRRAMLAMLCKTSVARKVILQAWKSGLKFSSAELRNINALKYFKVAVDACLLVITFVPEYDAKDIECRVYASLDAKQPFHILARRNKRLVSNVETVDHYHRFIATTPSKFIWRSGIKHDSSQLMELYIQEDGQLINGLHEIVDIEEELLFPMLKSSDIANGEIVNIKRRMLVPQNAVGSETCSIQSRYPKTWNYLIQHSDLLDRRGSSIYKNKPRFSIFGVGDYSFTFWKIAISGFYKKLQFRMIGPCHGKPVVFDDTCYFLACQTEEEAKIIMHILESKIAQDIFEAHIFWDAKRPITQDILSALDILELAKSMALFNSLEKACKHMSLCYQHNLFEPVVSMCEYQSY